MLTASSTLAVRTATELLYRGREAELDKQYPRMLVLLTHHWMGMEQGFSAVRKLGERKLRLQLWADHEARATYGAGELVQRTGIDDFVNSGPAGRAWRSGSVPTLDTNIQYLFVPVLSLSLLSQLSRLDDEHHMTRLILQGLCSGRKVAALNIETGDNTPSQDFTTYSMPSAMRHEVRQMLGSLRSYGMTLLDANGLDHWITDIGSSKQIITGDDVKAVFASGVTVIKLHKGSILTPLARDMAGDYGIKVLEM
ncbi:hypothetical protein [Paenibacillus ihuae]|uniref:hypothetical protein n=1 Tax=Paenibacillus ihuae TaxID=1232431 RepID=UPI0006D58D45|nr:hypothetical protein [Paenibacillus ihuae]